MRDDRTGLYRLFDGSDQLLYVGIAFVPRQRWKTHARQKPWWGQVALREIEWFPSRSEAESAEIRAIEAERPRYNILGTESARPTSGVGKAMKAAPEPRTVEQIIAGLEAARERRRGKAKKDEAP
ncbi:GIY-YIG nuclease family protein [Streptomyces sp. M-16]|uniref:GIY-YIG nuclease family protein n=1 Tax=Streptomyces sp. M-16 TaxID=3233040 RepID=UPI003F9A9C14